MTFDEAIRRASASDTPPGLTYDGQWTTLMSAGSGARRICWLASNHSSDVLLPAYVAPTVRS
jgi:hypothetical protein